MAHSIVEQRVVTLSAMDEPNLIPMFNAYAWAAVMADKPILTEHAASHELTLPCRGTRPLRRHGLLATPLVVYDRRQFDF